MIKSNALSLPALMAVAVLASLNALGEPAASSDAAMDPAGDVANVQESRKWCKFCPLSYIVNRFKDLSEVVSICAEAGPEAAFNAKISGYAQVGAEHGQSYFVGKGFEGQYGVGKRSGWSASFLCLRSGDAKTEAVAGSMRPAAPAPAGSILASPCDDAYKGRSRDMWSIGVRAAWFAGLDCELHPVEFADFLAGFVFYDAKDDDL